MSENPFIKAVREKKAKAKDQSEEPAFASVDEIEGPTGEQPFFPIIIPSLDVIISKGMAWERLKGHLVENEEQDDETTSDTVQMILDLMDSIEEEFGLE